MSNSAVRRLKRRIREREIVAGFIRKTPGTHYRRLTGEPIKFSVSRVRAAARDLLALEDEQAVFEDWCRERGVGPENQEPGAFGCVSHESFAAEADGRFVVVDGVHLDYHPEHGEGVDEIAIGIAGAVNAHPELVARGFSAAADGPRVNIEQSESVSGGWPGSLAREYAWRKCSDCDGRGVTWVPDCETSDLAAKNLGCGPREDGKIWHVLDCIADTKAKCTTCGGRGRTRIPGRDSRAAMGRRLAKIGRLVLAALDGQPDECQMCSGEGTGTIDAGEIEASIEIGGRDQTVVRSPCSVVGDWDIALSVEALEAGLARIRVNHPGLGGILKIMVLNGSRETVVLTHDRTEGTVFIVDVSPGTVDLAFSSDRSDPCLWCNGLGENDKGSLKLWPWDGRRDADHPAVMRDLLDRGVSVAVRGGWPRWARDAGLDLYDIREWADRHRNGEPPRQAARPEARGRHRDPGVYAAPAFLLTFDPSDRPSLDERITSRAQHHEHLDRDRLPRWRLGELANIPRAIASRLRCRTCNDTGTVRGDYCHVCVTPLAARTPWTLEMITEIVRARRYLAPTTPLADFASEVAAAGDLDVADLGQLDEWPTIADLARGDPAEFVIRTLAGVRSVSVETNAEDRTVRYVVEGGDPDAVEHAIERWAARGFRTSFSVLPDG